MPVYFAFFVAKDAGVRKVYLLMYYDVSRGAAVSNMMYLAVIKDCDFITCRKFLNNILSTSCNKRLLAVKDGALRKAAPVWGDVHHRLCVISTIFAK